jgi:hypothetical protein
MDIVCYHCKEKFKIEDEDFKRIGREEAFKEFEDLIFKMRYK